MRMRCGQYVGWFAGVAALLGLGTACSRPESMEVRQLVRIVAGAWADGGSRVVYDGQAQRLFWSEDDRLAVAACEEGERVSDGTARWRCFGQSSDRPFDPEYLLFEGEALRQSATGSVWQELYAFYPYELLADPAEDTFQFPTVQRYVAGSFDPDTVVMCSAPLQAELPESGTVHTSAFRLRHHTGYLRLSFSGLPDEAADERVVAVELATAGQPVAGTYGIAIDGVAGEWAFTPGSGTTDRLTVDFSEAQVTVGELVECWFALMPGTYETVVLTIRTASGGSLTMERGGLPIRSGVVKVQELHFRDGDRYEAERTLVLDAAALEADTIYGSGSVEVDGVTVGYDRLRSVVSDGETCLDLATRTGVLYNVTPVPGVIVRIEVDFATSLGARFTTVTIGETSGGGTAANGTSEGVNMFDGGAGDARYFRIEHTGTVQAAVIRHIRVVYR